MICKNCSHENAPDEKTCTNCGMPLTDDDAAKIISEEEAVVSSDADETAANDDTSTVADGIVEIAEGIVESINEEIETATESDSEAVEAVDESTDGKKKSAPAKKSKLFAFSGLIALVVICIGLWFAFTGVLAPKYDIPVDRSKFAVSYIKDYSLYQKPVSGQTTKVSETLVADTASSFGAYSYITKQSEDGKVTYFLESFDTTTFSGTLYVTYDNKTKTKIADDVVQGFVVSQNGETVVYMSAIDPTTATGQLYYYTKNLEPQLIADCGVYQGYMVSSNGKMVAYLDYVDISTGIGEYYIVKTGSPRVKVDSEVISGLKISDDGKALYLKNANEDTYTYDLYTVSQNKEPKFISSGVTENYVMPSEFSDKVAYVTVDEEQVYNFSSTKGDNEPSVILDDLMGFFAVDVENENYLLAKTGAREDASAGMPDMLLKRGNSEPVTVAMNMLSPQHAAASYDFKTIYYIGDYDDTTSTGTLYVRKEGFFGNASVDVIAQGVSSIKATKNGKAIAYITDIDASTGMGTLNVYKDGSSKVVAENILPSLVKLSDNGKAVAYIGDLDMDTYIGNLYTASTTGNSGSNVIDEQVYASFYSRGDKSVVYMKNYNSENSTADLYMWKGNGAAELVDTGISTVLFE